MQNRCAKAEFSIKYAIQPVGGYGANPFTIKMLCFVRVSFGLLRSQYRDSARCAGISFATKYFYCADQGWHKTESILRFTIGAFLARAIGAVPFRSTAFFRVLIVFFCTIVANINITNPAF
jgi:hypothetical protein